MAMAIAIALADVAICYVQCAKSGGVKVGSARRMERWGREGAELGREASAWCKSGRWAADGCDQAEIGKLSHRMRDCAG